MTVLKSVAWEAAGLLLVAAAVGLTANAARGRGLVLTRDYFPKAPARVASVAPSPAAEPAPWRPTATAPAVAPPAASAPASAKSDALANPGAQELTLDQVLECFHDPKNVPREVGSSYLFIDARDDETYQAGHIPGAVQLDHYYKDRYIPELVPLLNAAEHIIVYCNGGDCEDSILVCMDLLDLGTPPRKLMLFRGGWEAWTKANLAVETEGR